jgi:hypothetical protein
VIGWWILLQIYLEIILFWRYDCVDLRYTFTKLISDFRIFCISLKFDLTNALSFTLCHDISCLSNLLLTIHK